jgi:YHS domain-containing protein
MRIAPAVFTTFLLLVSGFAAAEPEAAPALKGNDPVALAAGRELSGSPRLEVTRGRYRYLFANEENRRKFQAAPERYAIQFGGACMRMGPLSGGGDSHRYLVHDGRIYVFASESCRDAFKSAPARYLDKPDEMPVGSPEQVARAKQLLERAVQGLGGAEVLEKLRSYEVSYEFTFQRGEQTVRQRRTTTITFPEDYRVMDDFGQSSQTWWVRNNVGRLGWEAGAPVEASVRDVMIRELYRQPVAILKAWWEGRAKAVALGDGALSGVPVERVAVSVRGAATTLSIDPQTGRVLGASYSGRAGGVISKIDKTFGGFKATEGIVAPYEVATAIDGKLQDQVRTQVTGVRINRMVRLDLPAKPD